MARSTRSAPLLTENNIHNWVGEAQFNRGMQYVNEGLVVPYSFSSSRVSGWCLPRAGMPGSYYVWARLRGLRICDAQCTCPLGKYGICPHVAAVLVGFVRNPESYQRTLWQRLMNWSMGRRPVALQPRLQVIATDVRQSQVA